MARPVAKYTIAAQEKHEKDEKVHMREHWLQEGVLSTQNQMKS